MGAFYRSFLDDALAPPDLRQRPIISQHRIAFWQRHLGDHRQRLVALSRIVAPAKVIRAIGRVGANDKNIVAA
jgi:hypothetical protein